MDSLQRLESGESLLPQEKTLCEYLEYVCNSFDHPVVARLAGGWVRDKLIDKESKDYDVTLEGCTGVEFANNLCTYLESKSIEHRVIRNPDQSKHLSSAKVCLFGEVWIDFSSLRSEKYKEDSRIPIVEEGTPLQDAERRDFTINTLYYNICTKKVEDFFNGYQDLQNKILRTPKDSLVSFQEDPLRILRALRFASRFNLTYEESIPNAIEQCRDVYLHKVTPERAAAEISPALLGPDPIRYIKDSMKFGFFQIMFNRSKELELDNDVVIKRVTFALSHLHKEYQLQLILGAIYFDEFGKGMLQSKKYGRKCDQVEKIISRVLRMTVQICDGARQLMNGADQLSKIKNLNNIEVGRAIRQSGELWRISTSLIFDEDTYNFVVNDVTQYANEHNLSNAYEIKPLLNGNELSKIYGVKGADLKPFQESMIDWQLEHPQGTKEDCLQFIESSKK
ncbi:polyA polymerase family protein [Trichomonas vaginalis G3]|uniref:PolyA polymerase family protein n=1 Tax=Trichomonas vaginalis (strain ATCC PRA-98 / G3) TaxID=412133 RepID=A2GDE2_TRIV3|nr:tRNA cytidylyltransferase protein [Trichomonas vaginalis G3]EAX84823.1 polyA polymerase family protein [Trichomonas vaginalis G3]KAI5497832.1 tRNA cytidylyltransferase protein [Trichomonas vaginalis G3]|eukprot:XP_001297753.1 polyA polymerase family protein [Trichomonas vaginalis G3]